MFPFITFSELFSSAPETFTSTLISFSLGNNVMFLGTIRLVIIVSFPVIEFKFIGSDKISSVLSNTLSLPNIFIVLGFAIIFSSVSPALSSPVV